jgi:hypothetical protein
MARRGTRRKRRSGGAQDINPAPYPAAVMAEGRQPSNAIMRWATTAGAPAPANMYNVAHGGKRRTHRKRSMKRYTKRSKRRGGDCGCGIRP